MYEHNALGYKFVLMFDKAVDPAVLRYLLSHDVACIILAAFVYGSIIFSLSFGKR